MKRSWRPCQQAVNTLAQVRPKEAAPLEPLVLCAAFEACPEALAVLDRGRVAHANAAFAEVLGVTSQSQLVGAILAELEPQRNGGSRPRLQTASERFSASGRDFLVVSARPLRPAESAAELRRSQKLEAVGRLVSGVAHDFNNLLTGVVLCCDLMLAKLEKNNPLRRYAEEMKIAGAQGSTLIQQLLAVVRQGQAEPARLFWNEVVEDMRDLLARLIGENIELTTNLASGLHPVQMDLAEAQQIILNLVLNARDAMPEGGRILLATRNAAVAQTEDSLQKPRPLGWIDFEVTDSGCGMEEHVRASMFEPFFTTKEAGQGNGLGLATVKSIVDQYGGNIEVASEPGKGTQITIRFPAAPERAAHSYAFREGNLV